MKEEEIVNSYVCLDIETTGLMPTKGAKIIEIGAIKIINGKPVDKFSELIDPEIKIPKKIIELTGINDKMIEHKDTYPHVLRRLNEFIGNLPIIAHNAKFDWDRFLLFYFKTIGIVKNNLLIDTLSISKRINNDIKNHKLQTLVDKYNIKLENHHRAYDDAYATARVYGMMKRQCNVSNKIVANNINRINTQENPTIVKINRISSWSKNIKKDKVLRRLYVGISAGNIYGTVYLDTVNNIWYNKDFPKTLDFNKIQSDVLKITGCSDINELRNYRN
ncbi:3'-5' exonuclease [Clostridium perfringens]|uniref:DNA polymerase III epsilon subunit n=1 Tax=Clostridium perfringens TaxID=1502 RepID=A0A140GS65_CLOPF|nr:3'-5' exonuclease [Clostridium perfringens]AMN31374.1 DNA polymerase III epsilon subunit [Clostridium perfringens]